MPTDRKTSNLKSSVSEVEHLWSALLRDDSKDSSSDAEWRYIGPPPSREGHGTRDKYRCNKRRDLMITKDRSLGLVPRLIIIHDAVGGKRGAFFNEAQMFIEERKRRVSTHHLTSLLQLGNSLGPIRLELSMKEAVAALVEERFPRAGSDRIYATELFDRPFRGFSAVRDFRWYVVNREDRTPTFIELETSRARRGVLLIHGVATFLNLANNLNLEDDNDQLLVEAFRLALDTLKDELASRDDQIAALTTVISEIVEENRTLYEENKGLLIATKEATSIGQEVRDRFLLGLADYAAKGVAAGVGFTFTAGALYLIGKWGGEIADLFSAPMGHDELPPAPPETSDRIT